MAFLVTMTFLFDQGCWDRFPPPGYPEDCTTGGMGPCTGVLVFDTVSRVTYGAHLTAPHTHEAHILDEMLTAASAEFAASTSVLVFVGGCREDHDLPDFDPHAVRQHVESAVLHAFPTSTLDIRWTPTEVAEVCITLDPETGKCDFT